MCQVDGIINLKEKLDSLEIKANDDYIVFLDSTLARFWFFTKKVEDQIIKLLNTVKQGHILSNAERRKLQVPSNEAYGHTIFVADEGYVFHPSYFHHSHPPR